MLDEPSARIHNPTMRHSPTASAQASTATRVFATIGAPAAGQAARGNWSGTVPLVCSVLGGVTKEASVRTRVSQAMPEVSSPMPTEDLKQRPCCGLGCENCPYEPRYRKGNTTLCAGREKSAAIAQADLRYWGDVNDAVAQKISTLPPEDQAKAASGHVSVLGSCGHSIRQGDNGVTVEIGKKCFTCLQADAPMRKAGMEKSAAANGCHKGEPLPDVGTTKSAAIAAALRRARNVTHTDPTPAQAEAGNYAKGELKIHGMTVKIENPKGTTRRGYNADGAVKWESLTKADYGYFKGTKAADGDAIDCFIGPNPDSELVVAIDQYRGDAFDETKFVLGVGSQDDGEKLYLAHYPKGWRLGPVSTATVQQLKEWLKNGNHKKSFKGQMVKAAAAQNQEDAVPAPAANPAQQGSLLWGNTGAGLASVTTGVAATGYGHLMPRIVKPRGSADPRMMRKLTTQAKKIGAPVVKDFSGELMRNIKTGNRVADFFRTVPQANYHLGPKATDTSIPRSAITMDKKLASPGILAHELGHAAGPRSLIYANAAGKLGMRFAPLIGMATRNEDTGRNAAIAGTVSGGATLASEFDASRRGYQNLRSLGSRRLPALRAGGGLPTYLLAAAAPMLMHYTKKWMGGYDKPATLGAPQPPPAAPGSWPQMRAASRFG
jgi:Inorganic Pyrophosphatase